MGFFKRQKLQVEDRSFSIALSQMFSTSNIYINDSIIEKIPSVAENISLIAGTIAQMPLYLYDENSSLQVTRKNEDYRELLLNNENSEFQTSYNWKYNLVRDLLLYGKSYSYIERKGTKIIGLHRVEPKTVSKKEYIGDKGIIKDIELHYTLNNKACVSDLFNFLIIEKGTGILNSTNLLELMMQYDTTVGSALRNVVMPTGILKTNSRLTQGAIDKLRVSWSQLYKGADNVGKTVILEEGLDYSTMDFSIEKLQLPQLKASFVEDVERLFNMHNIDTDEKLLKRVLSPIICCIENSIDKHILLEKEKKQNYYFRFNTKELLRPSVVEQANAVVQLVKGGLLTINEGRAYMDEKPFFSEENDKLLLSLGNCLANRDMDIQILNLGTTIDANGQKITDNNLDTKGTNVDTQ